MPRPTPWCVPLPALPLPDPGCLPRFNGIRAYEGKYKDDQYNCIYDHDKFCLLIWNIIKSNNKVYLPVVGCQ